MNKQIVNRIKKLEPGKGFVVDTESEQQVVLRTAKKMQQFGIIPFAVVTRKNSDGKFSVSAIEV